MKPIRNAAASVLLAFAACGEPPREAPPSPAASTSATPASPPEIARETSAGTPPEDARPKEKFADGARAFASVRDSLLKSYYAEGITEDDLYRAATEGMLEKIEPKMREWNKLITARELAEMRNDLKGELVGVGVQIKFDPPSGYADVLGTLPGSPSEKAGIVSGDKIVTVDGKLYKGMRLEDVVADIRGKAGEPVTLTVLRADKLLTLKVVRERVAYDQVSHTLLPEDIGYLRIPSFNERTPLAVKQALEELGRRGAKALVVDLRQSPGGSFERAVEAAELLLPEGAGIVTLKRRNKPEERHVAKGGGLLLDLPLAVLVDHGTSSGAEFVTAALREGRHARVVGARTKGKWSVQTVDDLPNGWAFKYTVSLFRTPGGEAFEGTGLVPDVEVSMDDKRLAEIYAAKSPEDRIAKDVQYRTARELLIRR